ncbi:MAG: signal peptidase I [Gemmataceae bacterium]
MNTGQPEVVAPSAPGPPPAAEAAPADPPAKHKSEFTIRRFVESAALFLCAVILLRSIAVEPFGVPTGSMAPTMAGNHKGCICPRCGYPMLVGSNAGAHNDLAASQRGYATAFCPNCYQGDLGLDAVPETAGDRLLVDKNIFEMRRPRRWEVAIFRCPSDPTKPYVKRVVALPGEQVQLRDGDVYINGELSRKTLAEAKAMRVTVFDNDYQPKGGGWKLRWRSGQPQEWLANMLLGEADDRLDGTELKWPEANARDGFRWLLYRHWLLDERQEQPIRDAFAYNGGALRHELKNVHDFLVEMEVEVGGGSGTFAVGLRDGHDDVTAEIAAGHSEPARVRDAAGKLLAEGPAFHLAAGRTYRVLFSFVDRRVSLSIDGNELLPALDRPPAADRRSVSRPVWLGVQGVAATVRHFRLDRDVHYSGTGRNGVFEPWPLGRDEFFMLGDNSANSEDSRYWSIPGVPASAFMGKPLLLHQPSRWVTIGPGWDLQTIDWQRVRWIR